MKNTIIILLTLALIILYIWQDQRYNFVIAKLVVEKNLSKERLKIINIYIEKLSECVNIKELEGI